MKDPLKPRDKITQKMTRDGAITENQTTGETERISKRTQDAELQKTPEQQAAQDAAQLQGAASPTSPLPHVPGAAPKADTGKTERVMEHIDAAHTRKASKKAVRKAQAEATAGTKSSRLQFTDEERAAPELEKYIKKSDKAADRLDKAKAAIPKEKKLVKERTFDETTGKGKTRLHFEEKDKPPGFKEKHNPLSRPTQEAGILVHNKIHSVEKDNSGVEGAHKSEEAAERGLKYGARKIKQGYRNHKLKPYWEAAKAEKAAFKANVDFQYHKTLHDNPQLTSNPISRFWQKQQIKKQYAKEARNTAKGIKGAAERTRKAAAKAAEKTKQTAAFVARHPAGVAIAVGALLLFIMLLSGLSSCGAMFSGTLNGVLPSVSDFTPDIVISSEDETNSVDRNLAEDISEIPGVKSVFGTKLHVAYPVEINGNAGTVDLFSYDESMLDSFKKSVMSGDLSKVYGNSGYALAIYNQDNRLNVGDKIKIGDTEIEIACIASEGVGSVSGAATMVCSEETYTQLTGEQDYALVSVVLEKNISETEVSKIRNLSSDYVFADNRAENSDVNGSYWVFRLAAYGFLAIISFITILNIMNSISMSVSARIKQYGAMRAVGMGNRQITKMITAEAITYAACGTIIGFVLGLLLHYLIYVKIIVTHFGGTWKVPVVPMEIIVLLVLVSCILAVYAPAKRIRNMAITATINEL